MSISLSLCVLSVVLRVMDGLMELRGQTGSLLSVCVCVCFRRERDKTGFSFCLESEWAGGQKVERTGKGLLQVWKRQIQQLNRVSADMATAILGAYPSPQLLIQVNNHFLTYERCSMSRDRVSRMAGGQRITPNDP